MSGRVAVEILQDGVQLTIHSDHFKLPVPGREGRLPGETGSLTGLRRGERIRLPGAASFPLGYRSDA